MMRAVVVAVIAGGFLCGATGAHSADKIRVSLFKIAASTNLWVAQKTGIFARNGLDAELIEFRNGNDGIMGHRGGSIDFVQSIPGTAMVALERGFDLVLLTQNETAKIGRTGCRLEFRSWSTRPIRSCRILRARKSRSLDFIVR